MHARQSCLWATAAVLLLAPPRGQAQATTATARGVPAVVAPGIPPRPDLVTVIPITVTEGEGGRILVPVEIDGQRGQLLLDTGSPIFVLLQRALQPTSTASVGSDSSRRPTAPSSAPGSWAYPHTLRLGTLVYHFGETPPRRLQELPVAWISMGDAFAAALAGAGDTGMVGLLGLPLLNPFETIIDYRHHTLMLIRLDSAGRRMVAVSVGTPRATMPLFRMLGPNGTWNLHYAVEGRIGEFVDTLGIDTGWGAAQIDNAAIVEQYGKHHQENGHDIISLDNLQIGGVMQDRQVVRVAVGLFGGLSILGAPWLQSQGIVGFNFRAGQLTVYR